MGIQIWVSFCGRVVNYLKFVKHGGRDGYTYTALICHGPIAFTAGTNVSRQLVIDVTIVL